MNEEILMRKRKLKIHNETPCMYRFKGFKFQDQITSNNRSKQTGHTVCSRISCSCCCNFTNSVVVDDEEDVTPVLLLLLFPDDRSCLPLFMTRQLLTLLLG
uniref:Uncharacterized protein n=1 Tax=Romanomermis culicivorax TaxID=13658 RepID=A0A915KCV2_ROMCU